jgi:hypothetical protein
MDDVIALRFVALPRYYHSGGIYNQLFYHGAHTQSKFGFTRKAGMLVSTPAGASDTALICSDIGRDNPDVIVMQIIRMVDCNSRFPTDNNIPQQFFCINGLQAGLYDKYAAPFFDMEALCRN